MNSKEAVQAAAVEEVEKEFKIVNTYVNPIAATEESSNSHYM